MIPANPGFTYVELWIDEDDKAHTTKHPIIGWAESSGSSGALALKPVMVVHRGDGDTDDWAVQYPDSQGVICNNGGIYSSTNAWIEDVKERREHEHDRKEKAFQRRLAELQAKPVDETTSPTVM